MDRSELLHMLNLSTPRWTKLQRSCGLRHQKQDTQKVGTVAGAAASYTGKKNQRPNSPSWNSAKVGRIPN